MSDPEWEKSWPEFQDRMRARLEAGHHEYGDGSFELPPEKLLAEIEEEALDIVGWGFILWTRVRRLRRLVGD